MLKSASAKILFLIAAFTHKANEYIDVFSSPMPRISGYPKRDKTVKEAINTLIKENLIEYQKRGENIFIKPSKIGYQELASNIPFYKSYIIKWDGIFRFIFYDISEKERPKRDAIRRIFNHFNLGRWQSSLWISAYPVDDLRVSLKKAGLLNYINILEVRIDNIDQNFIDKAWNLENLNQKYKNLYKILKKVVNKPRGNRVMIAIFRKSYKEFEKLIKIDPGLPRKILPKGWYGLKVRENIRRLQKLL